MLKKVALAVAAALAAQAASAASIDYHGYFRAGTGVNMDGGNQACYGHGGGNAHPVGRLGDECDMYAELNFGAKVAKQGDSEFKTFFTIAYGTEETLDMVQTNGQGNSWQAEAGATSGAAKSPWGGARQSVREVYATATNIIGDSTLWMGKRFGQRRDIHMNDFFLVMNSGYGAGFDNLSLGSVKFSYQWNQSAIDGADAYQKGYDWGLGGEDQPVVSGDSNAFVRTNKHELRLAIPVGGNGIELIGIYGKPTLTDAQEKAGTYDDAGVFLSGEFALNGILGGYNKTVFQYGTNGFALGASRDNFGGLNYATWFGDGFGYRLVNHGVVSLGSKIDLAHAFIFAVADPDDENGGNGNSWFDSESTTFIVRPVIKWTDVMSTAVEFGYDTVEYKNNPAHNNMIGGESLTKLTVAQQFAAGNGFWARPSFRVFASFYGGDRAVEKADAMFGTQVEAWW